MHLSSIVARPSRTATVFACALLASLAFAASQQAAASSAATPFISAGSDITCGVTGSGEGLCWGKNTGGRTNVPASKTWASISNFSSHTCGVTTSGEGLCWGNSLGGKTNVPANKTWASITAGNGHTCGVTTSGEGLCWGYSFYGVLNVPASKTWASISAGAEYTCGVTTSGEGLCWGSTDYGQTTVPTGKTWASITPGNGHTCGVTTSGEGLCWGNNNKGQSTVPTGKTWASITPNYRHSCGVTTSGEGLCWGPNYYGADTVPGGKTWASITAGGYHSCGVTTTGEGLCWGYDGSDSGYGVPADGRLTVPSGKFDAVVPPSDTTAPDPPVLSGAPSDPTNLTTALISFTGEANATFTCSLDNSVFADCGDYGGSPASLSALAEGEHTFRVKATDLAGNTSSEATATWTVDTTAPDAPVLSGAPSSLSNLRTASISLSGEVGATYTCSLDDAAFADCGGSPASLSGLTDGEHTLRVKAVDGAGNTSDAASATWTVDATAPAPPRISGVPADNTKLTTANIGIRGETDATLLCSVDGASYTFCSSPLALSGLALGDHTVRVKQTDEAGNTSSETTASWTIVAPNAPRLLAKVGLKVNTKTKVTTLTLKAFADTAGGANSIKWIEYFSHEKRPAANAVQHPAKIRQYATTLTLRAGEVAFWVRVKDTKGKWSGWYSTKH